MQSIERDETAVQGQAFLLHDAHNDLNTGVAHALNATSLHLGKRVYTTADASLYALADDEICTGWRLAVM